MKKYITVIIVAFLLSAFLGVVSFAEEPEVAEETAPETYSEETTPEIETSLANPVVVEEPEAASGPEIIPEVTEEVKEEPIDEAETVITDELGDVEDIDVEEEVITKPEAEAVVAEQPVYEAPQVSYSITFSNGAASFDTIGGTSVAVKDILTGLGYSVEGAVITFNPDSVDTSVIQVADTESGPVLSDYGPFAQADRKLVVYINGEAVELSVEDPVDVSGGCYTTDAFAAYFVADSSKSQDGHVNLLGNITLRDNNTINLSGTHKLYLNGYTINSKSNTDDIKGLFTLSSDATLNIVNQELTVTGTEVASKTYDGSTSADVSEIGTLSGVASGDEVLLESATATFASKDAAAGIKVTVVYSLTGKDAAKYVVLDTELKADISPKQLTVTGSTADGKTYDGTTDAVANLGKVSGKEGSDDVTVTASATFADKNAGNGKEVTIEYILSGAQAKNYTAPTESKTTADITKRSATITADNKSKTYGEKDPILTATITNLVGGDKLNYTLSRDPGESVGTYVITPSENGSNDNYTITCVKGTFTIQYADIPVIPSTSDIVIEEVEESILNDAQKKAVESLASEVINFIECRLSGSTKGYAGKTITFKTDFLKNHDASSVHLWHIAEDGTKTAVKFDINPKGEIVINDGRLGLYVITR